MKIKKIYRCMHACIYTGHKPWLSFVHSGVWNEIVASDVGLSDGQEEALDEDEVWRVESDAGVGPNCHLDEDEDALECTLIF